MAESAGERKKRVLSGLPRFIWRVYLSVAHAKKGGRTPSHIDGVYSSWGKLSLVKSHRFLSEAAALKFVATLPDSEIRKGCESRGDMPWCEDFNCDCADDVFRYRYVVKKCEAVIRYRVVREEA